MDLVISQFFKSKFQLLDSAALALFLATTDAVSIRTPLDQL